MLKKTKDAAALLAEVIIEAQSHNAEGSTAVKELVGNDAFKFSLVDNGEMGCQLFVKYS